MSDVKTSNPSSTAPAAATSTKKLGELLDEMDKRLAKKNPNFDAQLAHQKGDLDERLHPLIEKLQHFLNDLHKLESQPQVDSKTLGHLQLRLNEIESHSNEGIFMGSLKKRDIPRGQATVRDLLEQAHDLVYQLMDKVPDSNTAQSSEQKMSSSGNMKSGKKMGDLLEEFDKRLEKMNPNYDAQKAHQRGDIDERLRPTVERLQHLMNDLHKLESQPQIDTKSLGNLQVRLNDIESSSNEGIFKGSLKKRDIPRGQATVRELLEEAHELAYQLMDKLPSSPSGTSKSAINAQQERKTTTTFAPSTTKI